MAKQKKKPEDKFRKYSGNVLHGYSHKPNLPPELVQRLKTKRARFWCYRFRREATHEGYVTKGAPPGFKEFVEELPGFRGWDKFAETWDIFGSNPFAIVIRIMSVWKEWDQVMERVAVPVDISAKERHELMKALEADYKRRHGA
jgi:hypothetical protein